MIGSLYYKKGKPWINFGDDDNISVTPGEFDTSHLKPGILVRFAVVTNLKGKRSASIIEVFYRNPEDSPTLLGLVKNWFKTLNFHLGEILNRGCGPKS
jgi:hypothetical protein